MPRTGPHYPGSYGELRSWFPDDAVCLDYLDWLRWPDGFVCPHCAGAGGWKMAGALWRCYGCRRRVSGTARTVFQDTRTPLAAWFAAAWSLTTQKNGISALGLQRVLGLGSYQTAWAMLHRFRTAMVRPGRELLSGDVEVDETFFGGVKPGKRGRGAAGKVLVAIGVERGSVVVTDGLESYPSAVGPDYSHRPFNVAGSGQPAHVPLPGVHRVASLAKRWLLGTHQGAVEADHLQVYLNEFCFRFNRRSSRSRGLLFFRLMQLAAGAPPVTYRQMLVNPKSKRTRPTPPAGHRSLPASLALPPAGRPWRAATNPA